MTKYYFVTTFLPDLKIGAAPDLSSTELEFLLKMNLSPDDYKKVTLLRRLNELENLRHFWRDEELEQNGNFTRKEIEDNLLQRENYPRYVFEYLDRYESKKARLDHFPELLREFFRYEKKKEDGFVQCYLNFEWKWRMVFTALRASHLGRDLEKEFANEDPEDPFIQTILDQKTANTYTPPDEFLPLKAMYEENKELPLELNLALAEWRFNKIEEMVGWHTFDVSRILGFVAQLDICEKWLQLDRKKGLEFVNKLV